MHVRIPVDVVELGDQLLHPVGQGGSGCQLSAQLLVRVSILEVDAEAGEMSTGFGSGMSLRGAPFDGRRGSTVARANRPDRDGGLLTGRACAATASGAAGHRSWVRWIGAALL
jgi:hypothetical protein